MMSKNIMIVLALAPLAFSRKSDSSPKMAMSVIKADSTPKMAMSVINSDSTPKMAMSVINHTLADVSSHYAQSVLREDSKARMHEMSKTMTLPKALEIVQKSAMFNASDIAQVTGLLTHKQNLRKGDADGFGGLDGARLMLNDMIHEVMVKYDAEIAKCTDYYAQQCSLMEAARSQISAANYVAATARALILDAQYNIDKCDKLIPETQTELKNHNTKCKTELKKMNAKMKIIMGDIAVITMILEMSDCDKKLLQMNKMTLLSCHDQCSGKNVVSFNHQSLQKEVDQLKSTEVKDLLNENFADLFDGADEESEVELMQVEGSEYMETVQAPKKIKKIKEVKKMPLMKPPLVKTEVPQNPCTDPNQGAPATTKRGAKCTLKKSPQCYKLQGRFLQIQGEIADARDELLEQIAGLENSCEETKKTLEAAIANDGDLKSSSQTKLATATEKESSAGETGRQVAKENQQYNDDLMKQMTTCTGNYQGFEEELCALRKIRGDLFKKMKPGHPGFFQDCEVTKWSPEECSAKCKGGTQKLTRAVLTHPDKGCKCLPLSAMRKCNRQPCPVNCALASWGGWSKCSSKCGGGMASRVRDVKVAMAHGGKTCGSTSESKQCNVDACEKDCELGPWTKWTTCSKDCDGGSKRREKPIKVAAQGSGVCADKWDPTRLEYANCNVKSCKVSNPNKSLKCNTSMDVVMVVDGTPKGGKDAFALELKAANMMVEAFQGKGIQAKPNFALIHYSGPRTWSGVSKCTGKSTQKVNMETTCKIRLVQHFTDDLDAFKGKLNGLTFVPGCKLLSLGLMTVQAEFALGEKVHRTVVIVLVNGQPLSFRKTLIASRAIRKKARLVWVAVTKFSPLKDLKKWASRRWQENLVTVKTSVELAKPETSTHVIANICPKAFPKLQPKTMKKAR